MLLILTGLMAGLYKTGKRRSQKLLNYFQGTFSPLGKIQFHHKGRVFFLSRLSSGRGSDGSGGGSYPVLMTRVKILHRFVAGNAAAIKYYRGSFRNMKVHQLNHSPALFVASTDEKLAACALTVLPQFESISKLFEKNFSHLKVDQVMYVEKFFIFKKRTVLSYIGLPEEIYQDPKLLEPFLETILELSRNLGFGLPDSD
jgi:hypothetical protein